MNYDYVPKRNLGRPITVVILLTLGAVLSLAASFFMEQYSYIPQTVGFLLLLPAIQLSARFLFTRYLYRLRTREDGVVDFEIFTYRGGDRMQLVSRVGLDEITATAPLTSENKRADKGMDRFSFHPDMGASEGLVVSVRNCDGDCELLIAPDGHIAEVLAKAAASYKKPAEDAESVDGVQETEE